MAQRRRGIRESFARKYIVLFGWIITNGMIILTHTRGLNVARLVAYTLPGPLGVNETTAGAEIGAGGEGALTTGAGGAGEGDTGAVARADDGVAVVARGGCANASP